MSDSDRIPIDRIVIGKRARKNAGSVKELRASIERVGLLHPVVLNTRRELIAGMRRLTAVKEMGWKTVPVRVVDSLDDAVLALVAERDENTGEPLKKSEIVALGKQIEALEKPKAEERKANTQAKKGNQLRRSRNGGGSGTTTVKQGKNAKTRDKVGKAVGVGGKTYEQAKTVTENGTPELVAAMDAGTLSIKDAAKLAGLPPEQQKAVLAAEDPKKAAAEVAIIPPPQLDAWGIPVQPHAAEAWIAVPKFKELVAAIQAAQKLFNEVANLEGGKFLQLPDVSSYRRGKKSDDGSHSDRYVHDGLERAYQQVKNATPTHTVCPYQFADVPHPKECHCCRGLNWTPVLSTNTPTVCVERAKAKFATEVSRDV